MDEISEKAFQSKVEAFLKERKLWYLKVWGNGVQRSGVPDLLICCNGQFIGCELKKEDGRASALQIWNPDSYTFTSSLLRKCLGLRSGSFISCSSPRLQSGRRRLRFPSSSGKDSGESWRRHRSTSLKCLMTRARLKSISTGLKRSEKTRPLTRIRPVCVTGVNIRNIVKKEMTQ